MVTSIVPSVTKYYDLAGEQKLDLPAICCFAAIGFFLDDSTYFTNRKSFRPATRYNFGQSENLISTDKYFHWHYTPREVSFETALEEFSHLIETAVARETNKKKIILPISGGLDSRLLAVAMSKSSNPYSYSYQFQNGSPENYFGEQVANAVNIEHESFVIPKSYLWNVIEELALINQCYAEFTSARQMFLWEKLNEKGDVFLLGHGGDLFFDDMGVPDDLSSSKQLEHLIKKLIKPAGWELGQSLWNAWGLQGNFREFLIENVSVLLNRLPIENANARLRAFKTENYVSRWTSVNLSIFEHQKKISMPFFSDDICRFICTVPEQHLAKRKLQIGYIKNKSPQVAAVPWQKYYPCNLYDYQQFDSTGLLARRALIKGKRIITNFVTNKKQISRNWELQFLNAENETHLRRYLFGNSVSDFLPKEVVAEFYKRFTDNPVNYSQSVSMLLTMSLFSKLRSHFDKEIKL